MTPQDGWKQEADDLDAVLRLIGLDPQACRTDGGSLNIGRVRAAVEASARKLAAPERTEQAGEILQSLGWTCINGEWKEDHAATKTLAEQAAPGFVMVPVVPTSNMLAAMSGEWHSSRHDNARKQYAAALAARPLTASPTAQPSVEPVGEREDDDPWLSGDDMMGASS